MIPMIARPLLDPPDSADRMVPVVTGKANPVWLVSVSTAHLGVGTWHLNPGSPGEPEPLPWKRKPC